MRTCLVAILTGWIALGAIAAPATGEPRDLQAETHVVEAAAATLPRTWEWDPADATIAVGDKVTWENPTDADHGVESWDGNWDVREILEPGATNTLRFKKPGVYSYRCNVWLHSDILYLGTERLCVGMCGTITVTDKP